MNVLNVSEYIFNNYYVPYIRSNKGELFVNLFHTKPKCNFSYFRWYEKVILGFLRIA